MSDQNPTQTPTQSTDDGVMHAMKTMNLSRRDRKVPKFYIAGPFFNPAQVEIIRSIEILFVDACVPFHSPRLMSENREKVLTPATAKKIFQTNIDEMHDSEYLLAVVDWAMPPKQCLYVVGNPMTHGYQVDYLTLDDNGEPKNTCTVKGRHVAGPLNIPDAGTVFELGYARGVGMQSILFTSRKPTDALNVMLTQSAMGVCYGLDDLKRLLGRGKDISIRAAEMQGWIGKNS